MHRLPFHDADWSQAPEWAAFWAVDKNGVGYWYEVRPSLGKTVWWNERFTKRQRIAPIGVRCNMDMGGIDWKTTLEERLQSEA